MNLITSFSDRTFAEIEMLFLKMDEEKNKKRV